MKTKYIVEIRITDPYTGNTKRVSHFILSTKEEAFALYERQKAGIRIAGSPLMFVTHPAIYDPFREDDVVAFYAKTKRGTYHLLCIPRIDDEEDDAIRWERMLENRPRLKDAIMRAEAEAQADRWEAYGEALWGC